MSEQELYKAALKIVLANAKRFENDPLAAWECVEAIVALSKKYMISVVYANSEASPQDEAKL